MVTPRFLRSISITVPTGFDWTLVVSAIVLIIAGLITMSSFGNTTSDILVIRQIVFVLIGIIGMVALSFLDITFFKRSYVVLLLYGIGILSLVALFIAGSTVNGATSWFSFGAFSLQPSDPVKLILILILAKYLSRRHVEIARFKHLLITFLYFVVPFGLILVQPDFGSSLVIIIIWFCMVLVSGLSRRHLLILTITAIAAGVLLWTSVLLPYQKDRIITFIHPVSDIMGSGYNSYQSMIAVGSGQIIGKGVGYGTQARLQFLPEHTTDFIFASFAEEWGLMGSLIIMGLFALIFLRGIRIARQASSSFETLVALGIVFYITSHIIINIGMNIGVLPITGVTLPFMSYGGSHILTEFFSLGLLMSIERFRTRAAHPEDVQHEFFGV